MAWPSSSVACGAAAPRQEYISGYTPAQFIVYNFDEEATCHHMVGIKVDAPASVCFDLWMDWPRLVDFMDLIGQVGLPCISDLLPVCPGEGRTHTNSALCTPPSHHRLPPLHSLPSDRLGPQPAGFGHVPVLLQMG